MHSPALETLDVPNTYRQALLAYMFSLARRAPRTIGELGPWAEQVHELVGEIAKDPVTPDQVWGVTGLMAHALCKATGWKLSYCFDVLNGDLEHP